MNEQIEKIKNPVLRNLAENAQFKHISDFGMTVARKQL
jgi:hypothetical protein